MFVLNFRFFKLVIHQHYELGQKKHAELYIAHLNMNAKPYADLLVTNVEM